jgi:hypothetical protein
LNLLPVRLSCL